MIDLHSHILPGLDDGAETIESSLEIARAALADGIAAMAATPHVRDDYPTSAAAMESALAEVRAALAAEGVRLEVLPGGEIALDYLPSLDDDALRRFGLGGNPRYLLIETPYLGWPLGIEETLFKLRLRGFEIVLAHPERNADVQENPSRIESLVEAGILVQVTAASLDGRLGPPPRKTAEHLLKLGHVHMLASDAHEPDLRAGGLASASHAVGDDVLARWLTQDVPAAIVSGRPIPPRPEKSSRRRGFFRRGSDE
jgi:protein-tyrosine phosphatase